MESVIEILEAEDLKGNESLKKFKTTDDLAKSYLELEGFRGTFNERGVLLPNDKSTPEELSAYRKRMGIPDKFDGYKLSEIKGLHSAIKVTPESSKGFLEFAQKNGLNNSQVDALNQWYLGQVDGYYKQQEQAAVEQEKVNAVTLEKLKTDLKTKWGADYDKKLDRAKKLVAMRGGEPLAKALGNSLDNPAVLEFLAGEGEKYSEDDFTSIGASVLTGEVAAKKKAIDEMNTPGTELNKALMDQNHPKHKETIDLRTKLYEEVYSQGEAR